jgi:hypothetical protein
VVATFSVTLPVIALLLNVIVLFAELKFVSGVIKVRTGKSIAPDGELVTLAASVAVPVNPLTTFNVITPVPDEPCVAIVICDVVGSTKLNPLTAIVRFPEVAVLPPESVTLTVKGGGGATTAEAKGVPEIPPRVDKDRPCGRLPEPIDQVYGVAPPTALKFGVV